MVEPADHVVMVEDDTPVPVRYWWLKRIALASLVMIVGLVVLRLWWGYEAQRRLDEAIESYRAAGQMVEAAEFDAVLDAVPDEENAALLYEEAMGKLVSKTASGFEIYEFERDLSLLSTKSNEAAELLSLNAEVMKLVREAKLRKQIAWSDRLVVDSQAGTTSFFSDQRKLARFVQFSARFRMHRGEYDEAISLLSDLWMFSNTIIDHPKELSFLVGVACQEFVFESLEEVMALMSKDDLLEDTEIQKQLLQFLLAVQEEDKFIFDAEMSLMGSRAIGYTSSENTSYSQCVYWPTNSRLGARILDAMGRPAIFLDTIRRMDYDTRQVRAISASTWRSALTELRVDGVRRTMLDLITHPVTEIVTHSISTRQNMVLIFFRRLTQRRLVFAALAVKLFEIERGRWPSSLDELVPDYLPNIPRDPFGEIDDPIKYTIEDGRVVVYSVGLDGVDDGGELWDRKAKKGDRTFHLVGRPED